MRVRDAERRFVSAEATVLTSVVVHYVKSRFSRRGVDKYEPEISYRFVVGADTYEGCHVTFGEHADVGDQGWSRGMVAGHPEGSKLTIWYDPANPSQSVIDRGLPNRYWFWWIEIQPFIALDAVFAWGLSYLWALRVARRECLAGGWEAGWRVPNLGTVVERDGELEVGGGISPFRVVAYVVTGNGMAGLVAMFFVLEFGTLAGNTWGFQPEATWWMYVGPLAAGAVTPLFAWKWLRRKRLRIERRARRVVFGTVDVARDDMIGWRVTHSRSEWVITWIFWQGKATMGVKIGAWFDQEIAGKIVRELARVTRSRVIGAEEYPEVLEANAER